MRGGGKSSGRGGGARDPDDDAERPKVGFAGTSNDDLVALREEMEGSAKGDIGVAGGLANGSEDESGIVKLRAEGDGEGEGVGVGLALISSRPAEETFSCDPRGTWLPNSLL